MHPGAEVLEKKRTIQHRFERGLQRWNDFKRRGECQQIAPAAVALTEAAAGALQVADLFQSGSHLAVHDGLIQRHGDRGLPLKKCFEIEQRMQHPVAELSSAHRRAGAIQHGKEGVLGTGAAGDKVEVDLAVRIHPHALRRARHAEAANVIDAAAELKLEILQNRPGGTNGGVHASTAETIQ